jgi:CubicO group peptidase (beta-lactamase class C family)
MAELDKVIGDAVAQQDAPFLVAMVGNREGTVWSGSAGQRSPGQVASLDTVFRIFSMTKAVGSMAFMRFDEDIPGMRRAGSQGWAGVLNSHYWFDPQANVIGLLMTQSLPFVEPRFMSTYEKFERAVYLQ